ncbi:MAG: autotransporter outer membrane beta-barrel domain-containing protein [Desulfobulbus sp.]|nr:autotransporter outer membrane beta-barrel domain-containing protein [Desulfobulbus sp.]
MMKVFFNMKPWLESWMKQHGYVLFAANAKRTGSIAFLTCFLSVGSAWALTISGPPLTGSRHFTEDSTLTLTQGDFPNYFVLGATSSGQTVTSDPGTTITLRIADGVSPPPGYGLGTYGLHAADGGQIILDKVDIDGAFNDGLYVYNGGTIRIGDNSTVNVYLGTTGIAIMAEQGSHVVVGDNATLKGNIYGGEEAVVLAWHNSDITIGNYAKIINEDDDPTDPYHRGAVLARNGSTINIGDHASIGVQIGSAPQSSRDTNYIVRAGFRGDSSYSTVTIGNDATIWSDNYGTYGLYAYLGDATSGSTVTLGNNSTITLGGANSWGAYAYNGGRVVLGDHVTVETTSTGSWSTSTTTNAYGLYASGANSIITAGNDLTVNTAGSSSYGVFAESSGKVSLGDNASITTTGNGADALLAAGGTIELQGATIAVGTAKDAVAIRAGGTSDALLGKVTGAGKYNITGDIVADDYGAIDLTFKSGSVLTGGTDVGVNSSTLNMSFTDTRWDVTKDSTVTTLSLDNASTIAVQQGAHPGTKITIGNLLTTADGSLFVLRADPTTSTADNVIINDVDSAAVHHHNVAVLDASTGVVTGSEKIDLIYANGTNASNNLTFNLTNIHGQPIAATDLGGFQYALHNNLDGTTNTWFLQGIGSTSQDGSAAIEGVAAQYLLAYAETQALVQRLGDLRQDPGSSGLWAKGFGGSYEGRSGNFLQGGGDSYFLHGFDMSYWGMQAGADRKLEICGASCGEMYVGFMGSFARGDVDYPTGKGSENSKSAAIYGTYIGAQGWYVDAMVRYMWMDNDFDVLTTQGTRVSANSLRTRGLGASVETGYRFHFGSGDEGFHIEPQLQLSSQNLSGGDVVASNGLLVNADRLHSLLGRVGLLVGYETKKADTPLDIYAKVSGVREFNGDIGVALDGVHVQDSLRDSWIVYGVGATARLANAHKLFIDLERSNGSQFNAPWAIKGGYRFDF